MTGPATVLLSMLMIAGFALVAGGIYTLTTLKDRTRGILMLVAALVLFGNVAIMTI